MHDKPEGEHLYKFKFFYLGKKSFKYRLYTRTDLNVRAYFGDSLPPDYESAPPASSTPSSVQSPQYVPSSLASRRMRRNTDEDETHPTTTTTYESVEVRRARNSTYRPQMYETTTPMQISTGAPRTGATGNNPGLPSYAERMPAAGNSQTRVQVSANSFYANQPNEVLVEIFKSKQNHNLMRNNIFMNAFFFLVRILDGTLRAAINGDLIQQAQILNAFEIKFYSFAATKNRQVDEFFHNCVF